MLLYSYHSIISRSNLIHHCVKESLDAGWPNAGGSLACYPGNDKNCHRKWAEHDYRRLLHSVQLEERFW
jgi:hypothetical protein